MDRSDDSGQWPPGDLMAHKRRMYDRTGLAKVQWDGKLWEIEYRVPDWEEYRVVLLQALSACAKAGADGINSAIFDRMLFQRCLQRINDYHFVERAGAPFDPTRFLGLPVELMERAFLAWGLERGGELPTKGSSVLFAPRRAEGPKPDPTMESEVELPSTRMSGYSSSSDGSSSAAMPTRSSAAGQSPS